MASNNTNQSQEQAFWDFIRSMSNIPNMPPPPPHDGAEGHPPPPPPYGPFGQFGPFGPGMFFGPPGGHHGGHHARHGGPRGPWDRRGPGDWSEEEFEGDRRRRHRRGGRHMRHAEPGTPPENEDEPVELRSDDDVEMEKDAEKRAEGEVPRSRTASPTRDDGEEGRRGHRGRHGHGGHRGPRSDMFGGRGGRGPGGCGGGRGGRGGGRGGPQGMHGMHRQGHHERRGGPRMHGRGRPPFDMSALQRSLSTHPWAQALRPFAEANGFGHIFADNGAGEGVDARSTGLDVDSENFEPPVDVFSTEESWILHVALPGAKKQDIGVNWDADKGELSIAGVVHRPGDEEFLKTMLSSERRVGAFERIVKLPPVEETGEEDFEVDSDAIVAKLEDGILTVTVPKLERLRSWTDVKKVDIL